MRNAILIQQVYPGLEFEPMLKLTESHHRAYCEKHNLDYLAVYDEVFPHDVFLGGYGKIELMRKALHDGYDQVIWLDADTLIKDTSVNIAKGVPVFGIGACWQRIPQLHHWNVGALYIDNCKATQDFIAEWLASYPPKVGWKEQGVFNQMAMKSKTVVTISDKWNATFDVSMCPDAVVLGFHGQGNAAQRYKLMKETMDTLFPEQKAQGVAEVTHDS
jgi:hypothetical protein